MNVESLPPIKLLKLLNIFKENIQIFINKSKETESMDEKSGKKFVDDIYSTIENISCNVCKFEYNLFWHSESDDYYVAKQLFEIVKLIDIDFTTVSAILEKKSQTDQTSVNNAYELILHHTQSLEKLKILTYYNCNYFFWSTKKKHIEFYKKEKYLVNDEPLETIISLKYYFNKLLQSTGDEIVNCTKNNPVYVFYKYDTFVSDWKEIKSSKRSDFNVKIRNKIVTLNRFLTISKHCKRRYKLNINYASLFSNDTEIALFSLNAIFLALHKMTDGINDIVEDSKLIIYNHYVNVPSAIDKLRQFLFSLETSPFIKYQKMKNIYFYNGRKQIFDILVLKFIHFVKNGGTKFTLVILKMKSQ
ncbi:uncharacterized protein LOC122504826 [Leptopilina heterotoma]|uniref:uncharacterized protein LOC122504826 n=1 Tax=Leptopilina heterotoma TaxID=63436 RepID=UPI001CAA1052|nr:uncharacterized protein LOC122504826 [Leptopilina heterotoma]